MSRLVGGGTTVGGSRVGSRTGPTAAAVGQPFAVIVEPTARDARIGKPQVGKILATEGAAASSFGWSTAATGLEIFQGPAAATFAFSTAATGKEVFTGAAASTFSWSDTSSGVEIFTGSAASTFTWSDASSGSVLNPITGVGASSFGFSSSSSGDVANPVIPDIEAKPDRTFRYVPHMEPPLQLRIWANGSATFGWGSAARAAIVPPIFGVGASSFRSAIAGQGAIDVTDLLIHLEDERLLLGVGELELV